MDCFNCNRKFKYRNIITSIWSFSGYNNLICKNCNSKYVIAKSSKLLISIEIMLPILFVNIIQNHIIIYFCVYILFLIFISPFWVRFKLIDE